MQRKFIGFNTMCDYGKDIKALLCHENPEKVKRVTIYTCDGKRSIWGKYDCNMRFRERYLMVDEINNGDKVYTVIFYKDITGLKIVYNEEEK